MAAIRQNVRLVEEFGDPDLSHYTCNQPTTSDQNMGRTPGSSYAFGLSTQRHVDIRVFSRPGDRPSSLISNGSFENGVTGWGFTGASGVTGTFTSGNSVPAAFGHKYGVLTCTNGGASMAAFPTPTLIVSGNLTYTFTAWVYSPTTSRQAFLQIAWFDASAGSLGVVSGTSSATTVGGWAQVNPFTATAPAGAATAVISVQISNPVTGDVHYVDGVSFGVQPTTNGPESWTMTPAGTLITGARSSLYNHWPSIQATVAASTTATLTSVTSKTVDLTSLGTGANVALSMPSFPASSINLNTAALQLSSDGGQTWTSATFSSATHVPTSGNTYAQWPLSAFTSATLDLTHVNGVRILIPNSSGSAITFLAAALRLLDPHWVSKDVDFDNFTGALRQCIPLDANPAELPVPNNQVLPTLWHSDDTPGADDPRPVNGKWAAVFYTGSQTGYNSFTFNLRGVNGADETGLDLTGLIQAQLNGPQPGLSQSVLIGRTVGDLDSSSVGSLESETMENMDAVAATVNQSCLQFQVGWGSLPNVAITRSTAPTTDYSWQGGALLFTDSTISFQDNTFYLAVVSLQDTVAQLQLYTLDQNTFAIQTLLFDTGTIQDGYRFIRRQGRVGWKASFQDGDAWVRSVRPESLMFAEYRSAPLNSHTPVAGVRIYTDTCPADQLWSSWSPAAFNGTQPTLTADVNRTVSGQSTRVDIINTQNGQGLISNVLTPSDDPVSGVTDWAFTEIDFKLWFPSSALAAGGSVGLYLLSQDGNKVSLTTPRIDPDQWQSIRAFAPTGLQSGRYQLGITYSGPVTTFWVDSVAVTQRCCAWMARSSPSAPWTDLRSQLDSDTAGAVFNVRGPALQVRAQALRQDAVIMGTPKIVPVYAPLGRLVWPENAGSDPVTLSAPTPITVSSSPTHGTPTTFTSGVTPTPAGGIINWLWAFGDGASANGPVAKHTYAAAGSYAVTLTVEDLYGVRTTYNTSVGVS